MLNLRNDPGTPVASQLPLPGRGVLNFFRGVINLGAPPPQVDPEADPEPTNQTGTYVLIAVAVLALVAVVYFTTKKGK